MGWGEVDGQVYIILLQGHIINKIIFSLMHTGEQFLD